MYRYPIYVCACGLFALTGCDSGGGNIPTPIPSIPRDEAPAVSPDGEQLAYFHHEPLDGDPAHPTGLYVIDLSTQERTLLAEGRASNPDWSPDGERIAFDAGDIFTIRPDGSDLQQITDSGSVFFPRWAPDGSTLSYGRSGTQEEVGIWFVRLDEDSSRFGFGASPADWSPDGLRIVYEGPRGEAEGGNQIWIADTSGANHFQLTSNTSSINRYQAWSSASNQIAWVADTGVWLVNADGSGQDLLVADASWPAWQSDGSGVVFSALAPDQSRTVLWSIQTDGSNRTQLTF